MRKTLLLVGLVVVLTAPAAFAQTTSGDGTSGAGVQGLPGNKSGPAANPSGQTQSSNKAPRSDQSGVQGLPGNKSGPAPLPPKQ
jgi:hypothetical protein